MLVYSVLVLALGALWPLDWAPTRLDSLSPVGGHCHGTTWAMAEKVTGEGDPEEVVVVEGTTSDEVAKNKESTKSCEGWFKKWCKDWDLVDKNGKFHWGLHVVLFVLMVIFGVMALGYGGMAAVGALSGGGGGGGSNWVIPVGIVVGLGIFIGLGIAMWFTNKQ